MAAPSELGGNRLSPAEIQRQKDLADYQSLEALIKRSPATGILIKSRSEQIFGDEGEAFVPKRCTPTEIVWVQTSKGIETRILDGHHRARGIYEHYWKLKERFGERFKFATYDATEDCLTNKKIVPEREPDQQALTQTQYIRAVLEPVRQHEENAPQRAATHVQSLWEDVSGADPRYPSLFALTVLDTQNNPHLVKNQLFSGELPERIEALTTGLETMKTTMKDVGLKLDTALTEAFILLADHPDKEVYRETAKNQLRGALSALEVTIDNPNFSHHQYSKDLFAYNLLSNFHRLLKNNSYGYLLHIMRIYRALKDETLNWNELTSILHAKSPSTKYSSILTEKRRRAQREAGHSRQTRAGDTFTTSRSKTIRSEPEPPRLNREQRLLSMLTEVTNLAQRPTTITDREVELLQGIAGQINNALARRPQHTEEEDKK